MPQIVKNKIIFEGADWAGSLVPNYSTSSGLNQKGTAGLAAVRSFNPFRNYPYAVAGYNPVDVTNVSVVTTLLRKGRVNGINAYIVSSGDLVHQLDVSGTGSLNASPHQVSPHGGHANVALDDCVIYTAKLGGTLATRYFYSWSDNTDWDVGTYNFGTFTTGGNWDDDFMSTAPGTPLGAPYITEGKGKPHPMIVGDDDLLYIGDRNFLHAYDGQDASDADGKFFAAVLTLPAGYIITSFAKTLSGLMIFTYLENPVGSTFFFQGDARAWFWGYNELDITRSYTLNDNYTTEAFNYQGTVGVFTEGRPNEPGGNKISKMSLLGASGEFETAVAFIGNPPIRGGVEVVGDAIYFNSDGKVYAFGSPLTGVKAGLNQTAEGLGASCGMLGTFNSNVQFISSGTTTSGGCQSLSTGFYFQSLASTVLAEPIFSEYHKGQVTNVKVRFVKPCTPGRTLVVQVKDRSVGVSTVCSIDTLTGQTDLVQDFTYDTSGQPLLAFDALKCTLVWSSGIDASDAPQVDSVEVTFQEINIDQAAT